MYPYSTQIDSPSSYLPFPPVLLDGKIVILPVAP